MGDLIRKCEQARPYRVLSLCPSLYPDERDFSVCREVENYPLNRRLKQGVLLGVLVGDDDELDFGCLKKGGEGHGKGIRATNGLEQFV